MVEPELNRRRAIVVIQRVDEVLSWQRDSDRERDSRFVELGKYLCEVRIGRYWRVEGLHSFDEFLQKRFPDSRRKAYYLMAIHEQLPNAIHRDLAQVGWAKATDLARVARRDGENFDCATWLHKAKVLPKEDFKSAVELHLTGHSSERWEIFYFKIFKSQIPVIEQALETASLIRNRVTRSAIVRRPRITKPPLNYAQIRRQVLIRDGWRCQRCGAATHLQVHHLRFRSACGSDCEGNLVTLCAACHRKIHHGQL